MSSNPQKKFSTLRIYGIFVFVSVVCLAVIIYAHLKQNNFYFWIALLAFCIFGIVRILLMLRALRRETFSQTKHASELMAERNRLLTLVNSLGEAVFAVDAEGKITVYNSAALELIDSHKDILGKRLSDVLPLIDAKNKTTGFISEVLESGKIVIRDDLSYNKQDNPVALYIIATPVKENGQLVGAIVLTRDISRQKNLQAQKDEFLSVVSHELRTPVAIVEADLSTALLPNYAHIDEKALKLLRSASQNISYLSGLLQDISDMSHAQRAVLDVELHNVNCVQIVKEIYEDFRSRAQKQDLELKLSEEEDIPEIISSQQRIQEVIVNFLTNAIKYSAGIGRVVEIKIQHSAKSPGGVTITITDQGLGLSQAEQAKLFSKFYRSSREQIQAIKGTGMGLYISAQQAKKIGATIFVESQINKGSSFSLDLPAKVPANLIATTQ